MTVSVMEYIIQTRTDVREQPIKTPRKRKSRIRKPIGTLNDRFGEGTIVPAKLLEQSKLPPQRKVEIRMPRGMI